MSITILKLKYDRLTTAEKKIADVILSDPEAAVGFSAAELADRAGVAPSTTVRLGKSLGYSGYADLKISISRDLGKREKRSEDDGVFTMPDDGGAAGAFSRVFQSSIKALQDTAAMLVREELERVVSILYNARRICFFGVGTSATVAMDAHYRLLQLGYDTCVFTDELYMRVAASNMKENDVAVCISHSGNTTTTADAMALA